MRSLAQGTLFHLFYKSGAIANPQYGGVTGRCEAVNGL